MSIIYFCRSLKYNIWLKQCQLNFKFTLTSLDEMGWVIFGRNGSHPGFRVTETIGRIVRRLSFSKTLLPFFRRPSFRMTRFPSDSSLVPSWHTSTCPQLNALHFHASVGFCCFNQSPKVHEHTTYTGAFPLRWPFHENIIERAQYRIGNEVKTLSRFRSHKSSFLNN
jgi:hypothetical protein